MREEFLKTKRPLPLVIPSTPIVTKMRFVLLRIKEKGKMKTKNYVAQNDYLCLTV